MQIDPLKAFLAPLSDDQREVFALLCETSVGHLNNVKYGLRPCATDTAVHIERESAKQVRRWDLRPSDWWKHWPDLIGSDGAPPVEAAAAGAGA